MDHLPPADCGTGGKHADHLANSLAATLFLTFGNLIPNIDSILDAIYLQLANRFNYAATNA
ncbi:hypothetical protein [Aeromonas allosaccharophila]|uniref:hypothetical protein n=1 Tax=Aeromonas allosaccharophila TaxID=656 RepID=UPI0006948CEB|nr:hypothetical protein [Aeromonas allosaccharophila]